MNERHLLPSDEATWTGPERFWASVQQFAPKRLDPIRRGLRLIGTLLLCGLEVSFFVFIREWFRVRGWA